MNIKDIDISKLSYTSKDFPAIYPELLDLTKQLTDKWDPSHSNESDPGVVLLKVGAFIADHINYNIDKNILENFLPSATQDKSVRNIVEINGYIPRYYIAATGNISLQWTYDEDSEEQNTAFTIPAFTLTIGDTQGTVTYTQIEDISILGDGIVSSGKFIEGTLQTLSVNNIEVITLENLDDENRIYFPEMMVAQNGIYVSNTNKSDYEGYWERDNYLLTRPNESRIYKVDFDSDKNLPYIEFPSDIANLIGDGLTIKYITTSGLSGNVPANTLVKINSPTEFYAYNENFKRLTENITVTNTAAITNGKDPETIDEMYKSYKKIVGTFDTLVTCKDYANKINSLEYDDSTKVVSNSYVTDRRTDYNKALNVIVYDEYKEFFKNISLNNCRLVFRGAGATTPSFSGNLGDLYCVTEGNSANLLVYNGAQWKSINNIINLNDFSQLTAAMSYYDISIYALTAFSINDYISINPAKALNNSFTPINELTLREIKNSLEDTKCISHTYNDCARNELFCFKNYLPLTVSIQPFNKVTAKEKTEIVDNVYRALTSNFNSSQLLFGNELDYTTVHDVIVNADPRISDAYVQPFEYHMMAMYGDGSEVDPYTTKLATSGGEYTIITDMIAKNVLAGRVCLFNIDDDFSYKYGQIINPDTNEGIYNNISHISTEAKIKLNKADISSSTQETITTTNTFISTYTQDEQIANIKYIFNCPNKNSKVDRQDLAPNNSYTLVNKGKDSNDYLKIIFTSKSGKVTEYAYASHDNITYTIKNNLNNMSLSNAKSEDPLDIIAEGSIEIQKAVVNNTYLENFSNLQNYVLNKNEHVQIISPNYYSSEEYSNGVSYRYEGKNTISANIEHELTSDERILLQYSKDGVVNTNILSTGDIIKCSFSLAPTNTQTSDGTLRPWTNSLGVQENLLFKSLASNQTISKRSLMKTVLDNKYILCYWLINSDSSNKNRLFKPGETSRILEVGDYFIYANSTLNEMVILGSGTKIIRTDTDDAKWIIDNPQLSIETISEQGTAADISWQIFDFSEHNLNIIEMNIVTLGEGDTLTISGWDLSNYSANDEVYLDNDWKHCTGNISYISAGTTSTLPATKNFYQIRSRLDLNMSKNTYQELYDNQKITISSDIGETIFATKGMRLQSNYDLNLIGGQSINLSSFRDLGYSLNIYAYEVTNIISNIGGKEDVLTKGDAGYTLNIDTDDGQVILPFCFDPIYATSPSIIKRLYLLPIYIKNAVVPIKIEVKNGEDIVQIREFNSRKDLSDSLLLTNSNIFYIEIPQNALDVTTTLTLNVSWKIDGIEVKEPEIIIISEYFTVKSNNGNILEENLAKSGFTSDQICGRIREIIENSDSPSTKPCYAYTPEKSMAIENPDFSKPEILWDINNVANMMSIPQIDLNNSNIDIALSMRNY